MEKDDKGSTLIRIGGSGWEFLLVPAYPGCPGSKAVKRSLLLLLGLSICVCLHICLFGWTRWRHSQLALRRLLVYSWLDHIQFRSHVMLLSGICNVLLWVLEHLLNKSFPVSVSVLVDSFLKYPEQSPQFGSNGNSGNVHLFLKTQTFLLQNVWWIANRFCLSVLMLSCTATIMC